jgi:hypothetical protein
MLDIPVPWWPAAYPSLTRSKEHAVKHQILRESRIDFIVLLVLING